MTKRIKHLHEIKGRYAVRITIPEKLRPIIGARELREWLGTDPKLAARNAPAVIGRFYAQIDEARISLEAAAPSINSMAKAHYERELLEDDRARFSVGNTKAAEINALFAAERALRLRLLVAGELSDEEAEALMGYAVDSLEAKNVPLPDMDRKAMLKALAEVQLEAMSRFEERDGGRIAATIPASPLLQPEHKPTNGESVQPIVSGESLSEILQLFHKERAAGGRSLSEKTTQEHKVAVRMFEEFMEGPIPARSITRADMRSYKDALLETPGNYVQRFPGLTLPQSIVANKKRGNPYSTLSPKTINNKWVGHIGALFNWAVNNGYWAAAGLVDVELS